VIRIMAEAGLAALCFSSGLTMVCIRAEEIT
jgi:hypothetical protein